MDFNEATLCKFDGVGLKVEYYLHDSFSIVINVVVIKIGKTREQLDTLSFCNDVLYVNDLLNSFFNVKPGKLLSKLATLNLSIV